MKHCGVGRMAESKVISGEQDAFGSLGETQLLMERSHWPKCSASCAAAWAAKSTFMASSLRASEAS